MVMAGYLLQAWRGERPLPGAGGVTKSLRVERGLTGSFFHERRLALARFRVQHAETDAELCETIRP